MMHHTSLMQTDITVLPPLVGAGEDRHHSSLPVSIITKNPTSVISEGMPRIPTKLVEKICRWEYVDLVSLLHGPFDKSEELI